MFRWCLSQYLGLTLILLSTSLSHISHPSLSISDLRQKVGQCIILQTNSCRLQWLTILSIMPDSLYQSCPTWTFHFWRIARRFISDFFAKWIYLLLGSFLLPDIRQKKRSVEWQGTGTGIERYLTEDFSSCGLLSVTNFQTLKIGILEDEWKWGWPHTIKISRASKLDLG